MEVSLFKDCKTLADARKVWIKLAKEHHPDISPADAEIMKTINEAYQLRISELDTVKDIIHKFNLPDGQLVTMNPLKGRHVWKVLRIFTEDSDLALCTLLELTVTIGTTTYPAEWYRSNLSLATTIIIINEFFKHNFKK